MAWCAIKARGQLYLYLLYERRRKGVIPGGGGNSSTVSADDLRVIIMTVRGCIQKFPHWVDNEIYAYNNKHSLRINTKGYGDKIH
jgi:hypothetical protein